MRGATGVGKVVLQGNPDVLFTLSLKISASLCCSRWEQHRGEMKRLLLWNCLRAHRESSNMYQWASLCLLAIVHYAVVAHHILSVVYKQLLPGFASKASRGIRPVAPKCIALSLNDAELEDKDLQRLGRVLNWSVNFSLMVVRVPADVSATPLFNWGCRCAMAGLQHAIVYCAQGSNI